jgi:hypothetical protein
MNKQALFPNISDPVGSAARGAPQVRHRRRRRPQDRRPPDPGQEQPDLGQLPVLPVHQDPRERRQQVARRQGPGAYPTKSYKYWFTNINICNLHIFVIFNQYIYLVW